MDLTNRSSQTWLHFLTLTTAFNSFTLFAVLCKSFAIMSRSEVLSQILCTTVFIAMLGLASLCFEKIKRKELHLLLRGEFVLTLFFSLTPILVGFFQSSYYFSNSPTWLWFPLMLILMVPFGFLTGFELPFFLHLLPKRENYLLFLNYSGSLIASMITVLVFHDFNFLITTCAILGFINFTLYLLTHLLITKTKLYKLLPQFLIFTFIILGLANFKNFYKTLHKMTFLGYRVESLQDLKSAYSHASIAPDFLSKTTPYQTIDIVPAQIFRPNSADNRWGLYLNHQIQFFSDSERIYHQVMSFFPLAYLGSIPKDILILGGGDLGLARELSKLKFHGVNVSVVELDPEILKLAKTNPKLRSINKYDQIKNDINIINDDAVNFLRSNNKKYDYILADFPFPTSFELGKLYTKEFYKLVHSRLNTNGFFVLDFPYHLSQPEHEKDAGAILLNTLRAAGFQKNVIFGVNETFVLNLKSDLVPNFDYTFIDDHLDNYVITNMVDRTEEFKNLFKRNGIIHSIFKPTRKFKIDQY